LLVGDFLLLFLINYKKQKLRFGKGRKIFFLMLLLKKKFMGDRNGKNFIGRR